MTKEELISSLKKLAELDDTERAHSDADELLLKYINDADIENAYNNIEKWYA